MASYVKGLFSPRLKAAPNSHTPLFPSPGEARGMEDILKDGTETEALLILATSPALSEFHLEGGRTLLHVAARKGWAELCNALITNHDCDVTARDDRGHTSLHYAVIFHQTAVVELLAEKFKASFLVEDNLGNTPIHFACHHGHQAIIEYISGRSQLDLTCRNHAGDTPFHLACMFLYMTKFLCSTRSEIDFESRNKAGHTPVQVACLQGRWEVALYLVTEQECFPTGTDHYGNTLLHELSRRGYKDTLKYIVSCQVLDICHRNRYGDTPLHVACRHAQMPVVEFLVTQDRIDPNCQNKEGLSPAQVAFRNSHWHIGLKLIVEHRCSPVGADKQGNTPLHGACMTNNVSAVKHIVSTGVVPIMARNAKGDSPFHIACYYGNMENVLFLMSLGGGDCRTDARNNEGDTPLHFAAMAGHDHVVSHLVANGKVDPMSVNKNENTPLHLACEFGHTEAARVLVESSPKEVLSIRNKNGKTPAELSIHNQRWETAVYMATLSEVYVPLIERSMHLFCSEGYFDLVQKVVQTLKIDINCRDRFKNTPLHHACKSGSVDIIQFILSNAKADPSCVNELLNAPIHTACLEGHLEAVRYLMSMSNVDPNCANKSLDTPLHMACSRGHYDVVKFLLKSGRVDPFPENKDKKKPLDLIRDLFANSKELRGLFEPFVQSVKDHPVHTYAKVFLCGDCGAGKSSLAKVLSERSGNRRRFSKGVHPKKLVSGVKPQTVGIVSDVVNTPEDENFVLFDLSGHPNYHSSHVSYVHSLNETSPSIFVLVVNVNLPDEEIKERLLYWYGLVISTCNPSLSKKSKVIVVGSHIDKMEKKEKERVKTFIDDIMSKQDEACPCEYVTLNYLNCSKLYSKRLLPFFNSLLEACKVSRPPREEIKSLVPYSCLLYSFLKGKVKQKATTLVNLVYSITSNEECMLPTHLPTLDKLLVILRDHGLIQYLKSNKLTSSSWVIIDHNSICKELMGNLLAPTEYSQLSPLSPSAGITTVSSLEEKFPQIPPQTLVGVLSGLRMCYEFNTKSLAQVSNNLPLGDISVSSPDKQRWLLFPGFLPSEEPSCDLQMASGVGWCFFSSQSHPFVHSYLVQVLVAYLLREFCLPSSASESGGSPCGWAREFEVWRRGLKWTAESGTDVKVKLKQDHLCFTAIISYSPEALLEHMKLRRSVLSTMASILKELCPTFQFRECVVPCSQASTLNDQLFKDLEFYSLEDVARAVVNGKTQVYITENCSTEVKNLLLNDPYIHLSYDHFQKLHDGWLSSQCVPESFLQELSGLVPEIMEEYKPTEESNYRLLRKHINQYSVLANSEAFASRVSDHCTLCMIQATARLH